MDNIHFTLQHLLPYQRHFIFVNSIRSAGKTYGSYYYFIRDYLNNGNEFCALCRTQEEKKAGYLKKAVDKVITKEFSKELQGTTEKGVPLLKFTNDNAFFKGETMAHCIALSEAVKIKKNAYPKIKWLFLDEYAIEENNAAARYVNGWSEPDLLLSIYHTIDREEDRVICVCMGNNISAYNPYHLHKAFKIPYTEVGNIWKSKNVLFENYRITEELKQQKSSSLFVDMIEGTRYGDMAVGGEYIYDSSDMVYPYPIAKCRPLCTLIYRGERYGIWKTNPGYILMISKSINPTYPRKYAVLPSDMCEGAQLVTRQAGTVQYFLQQFRWGNVRFETMEVKKKFTEVMPYLL